MSAAAKWGDLAPRVISAIVMAFIGAAVVWTGGPILAVFISVLAAAMFWELVRMLGLAPESKRLFLAAFIAVAIGASFGFLQMQPESDPTALPLSNLSLWASILLICGAVVISSGVMADDNRKVYLAYGFAIMLACFGLFYIRERAGLVGIGAIIGIVILTDVAGYFAGRILGGPKFWPKISPKKTWSGTAAGWVASAVFIVTAFWGRADLTGLLGFAVLLSFASQIGDIAESAIKRATGIKDSSNLIPGHGGVLDRFDGMIGAGLVATLAYVFLNVSFAL